MYTKCTEPSIKEDIITEFSSLDFQALSLERIIIARPLTPVIYYYCATFDPHFSRGVKGRAIIIHSRERAWKSWLEFSKPDSTLRIIIGTISFVMGLDCPDVRQILHWGDSLDLESYMGGVEGMGLYQMLFCFTLRQMRE